MVDVEHVGSVDVFFPCWDDVQASYELLFFREVTFRYTSELRTAGAGSRLVS